VCSLCSVFVGFIWRQAYCQEPTVTMATTVKTFLVWLHMYIPTGLLTFGSQGLDYTVLTLNFMDSFILMQLSLATSILIGFFCVSLGSIPSIFSSSYCWREPFRITDTQFYRSDPSCHLSNNVVALKETQRTDPNQWPGLILSSSTAALREICIGLFMPLYPSLLLQDKIN